MDYRGGLKAMYNNPNWLMQTSLIGVCSVIPVVGSIAAMGYAYECAAYLHLTNREGYPDFNFGRFGAYLARGIGPFLISLVFMVVLVPLFIVEYITLIAVALLLVPMQIPFLAPGVGMFLGAVFFVINSVIQIFQFALMIRGGLSGEISEAFRFAFCGEFAKRAGNDAFFAQMYLSFLASLLLCFAFVPFWLLGLMVLPAIGIFMLSYAWICCQLYRSYLTEKGPPFRVKCDVIEEG